MLLRTAFSALKTFEQAQRSRHQSHIRNATVDFDGIFELAQRLWQSTACGFASALHNLTTIGR
jgi:hypothetical protein